MDADMQHTMLTNQVSINSVAVLLVVCSLYAYVRAVLGQVRQVLKSRRDA
jgi:hypothetical protein